MELRHLRYFRAVAESGSFTAAGRKLHVSQSSISEQISDLEAEIGGVLLDRSGRQVRLTPQGQVFLMKRGRHLRPPTTLSTSTRRSMRGEVGTLSVGFSSWGAGGFFRASFANIACCIPASTFADEMHVRNRCRR